MLARRTSPGLLLLAGLVLGAGPAAARPLAVCATVPDLGALAREVGGEAVSVTVFTKGTEDPHFVEPRPSFVKALSQADLLLLVGMDLEAGYLPVLLRGARNGRVLPGARGHLDASQAVAPLGAPPGPVDRAMGDVHALGNPHYLTDPVNGLRVARLIRDRLSELRPADGARFAARTADFERRLGAALVGAALAAKYDVEKLGALGEHEGLDAFLAAQGDAGALAGWLGRLRPQRGARVVDDHDVWPYFARRFGVVVIGHMEPKPGITPTTRHLGALVERMRAAEVRAILASAYYDQRHARFLAERTGARVAAMANQVGARPGTEDYLAFVDHNVRELAAALGEGAP
jgi:ABC-type Zn uptake system ZnuABC Zn-binding protein ZnuA